MQSCDLVSTGGALVAACFHEPPSRPRGVVVIGGAMGVRQDYYAPFARWLAGEGYLVATFDYRGIGGSRRGPLRGLRAEIRRCRGSRRSRRGNPRRRASEIGRASCRERV